MSVKRIIWLSVSLIILLLVVFNIELIGYGIAQARGQIEIIVNAEPVEAYLDDPNTPDSLKQKLLLVQKIRAFAMNELSLKNSKNYTTLYDQKGKELMFVVSASPPFELKPYKWHFPIIGSFSYKGFFDKEKAYKLFSELEEQGYDARVRTAGGWSTLGILRDPILSNMLKRDEGRLADLIIHELTHATVFVKDSLKFNENLATFIGQKGAIAFLEHSYGKNSPELKKYRSYLQDKQLRTNFMLKAANRLDSLYQTFGKEALYSEKKSGKEMLIDSIVRDYSKVPFINERYKAVFANSRPNNAYFLSYRRYNSHQEILEELYQIEFQRDIKKFIAFFKDKYG